MNTLRNLLRIQIRLGLHANRGLQLSPALFVLPTSLALAVLAVWAGPSLGGGVPRVDNYAFFIPMYSFLGERLRVFDVPGWNPYVLSGAPFAGDPQSGWMYLPAMLFFTLWPAVSAYTGYAIFHLVLAGTSTFAFCRILGMGTAGAAVAGLAYQFSPFVEGVTCCSIRTHIASWIPLALIGVELALLAQTWFKRVAALAVAGLAISQMLSGWIGQGAYYGLLATGAYLFFRTVVSPVVAEQSLSARLRELTTTGLAMLCISFGLAAAGILPRLDATSQSNLAAGVYRGAAADKAVTGGWAPVVALDRVLSLDDVRWYVGSAVLALAVVAPFVAPRRSLALFFAVFATATWIMTLDPTPLHWLLYQLPQFQVLHEHVPNRVLVAFFLNLAVLAGMTVDSIARPQSRSGMLSHVHLLPALLIMSGSFILAKYDRGINGETIVGVFAVSVILAIVSILNSRFPHAALVPQRLRSFVIPSILAFMVFWDPAGRDVFSVIHTGTAPQRVPEELHRLSCLGSPSKTAVELQEIGKDGPFRYFGYDPDTLRKPGDFQGSYRVYLWESGVQRLLVGNQAMCLHVNDVQGYNPVQSMRYVEYMAALNGRDQEYHESSVLPTGITSPLLDALNAQYIVMPRNSPALNSAPLSELPIVLRDKGVVLLSRPSAQPRAWLVHEARNVAYGEALTLLAKGKVDSRRTALLEIDPPALERPSDPMAEVVEVTQFEPDQIAFRITAAASALLVVSEVWDPGWSATVDGQTAPVLVADHALRAVPVPQGDHTVIMRYDPISLRVGLIGTSATAVLLCGVLVWLKWSTRSFLSDPVPPRV